MINYRWHDIDKLRTPALTVAELAERYGFRPHGLAPDVAAATPAPEPDRGFVVDYGLETALYVPPFLPQSATPEPSAVTDSQEYCRGYTDGVNDGAREILHAQDRDNRLADAVKGITDAIDWQARAETAEAQLAAVLGSVKRAVWELDQAAPLRCRNSTLRWRITNASAILDAALLSSGGETGEKPYRATCRLCAAALNRDTGSSLKPNDCPGCGTGVGK